MKREKIFKYVLWAAIGVQLVIAVLFVGQLLAMNILPTKYLVAIVAVLVIEGVFALLASRKVWVMVMMFIISLIISAVMFYAYGAIKEVDRSVTQITTGADEEIIRMSIVVLNDSEVTELTNMSQFTIAYINDNDYEACQKVMKDITEAAGDVTFSEFSDYMTAVDALYNKTVDAVIMNHAYIDVLKDMENYKDFDTATKIISSSDIVTRVNIVKPEEKDQLDSFVIYISGIDTYGSVNTLSRSDVNILAAVNTKTKEILLVNTPRDYYVPLPISRGVKDKLTHAGIYGVKTSMGTLEMLYGIEVNYYLRMNFTGFTDIIDALGGVDVYSEYEFTSYHGKFNFTKGYNHLNGAQALGFARERYSFPTGDHQRGKNQMEIVKAMIKKLATPEILYNYTEVLDSIAGTFQTNMSSEDIYSLVRTSLDDMSNGWKVESYAVTGTGSMSTTFSMPNFSAYVMVPNEATVNEAKSKINAVLAR